MDKADIPEFSSRCYELLKSVPRGKVTTYRELAHAMGCKAYRAVGNAMNRNPFAPAVPCHRVVRSNGDLGGYAYGVTKKVQLLKQEGVSVKGNRVADLERVLYKF